MSSPPPDDGLQVRFEGEPAVAAPVPWRRRVLGWLREGLIIAAVLGVSWVALGWLRSPSLPTRAPDFTLTDLDGHTWTLSELHGKTVVLNFWATWCGPCRAEVPGLAAFSAAHPDIPLLGIAVDGDPAKLRATGQDLGITYPILLADAATKKAYDVSTLPTTIVVNARGEVRAAHAGLMIPPHLWLLTR